MATVNLHSAIPAVASAADRLFFGQRTRPFVVIVDVDQVMCDMLPEWLKKYGRKTGDIVTVDQITEWDVRSACHPDHADKIHAILDDPWLYDHVLEIPGAVAGVEQLRQIGCRVVFATSAAVGHAGQKLRWLQRAGALPKGRQFERDYVECTDKALLRGDVIVDDKRETCVAFMQAPFEDAPRFGSVDGPRRQYAIHYAGPGVPPVLRQRALEDERDGIPRGEVTPLVATNWMNVVTFVAGLMAREAAWGDARLR